MTTTDPKAAVDVPDETPTAPELEPLPHAKHPGYRESEYGMHPTRDYLPAALSYDGPRSEHHAEARAEVASEIATNHSSGFWRAYCTVRNRGLTIRVEDVPDAPPGARARFVTWVRETLNENNAGGLVGPGWWRV